MALTALEEARGEPGLLVEIRGTISANVAADLLKAHNKAFRAWCRANGESARDLVIVDSGTGSYWARLKDASMQLYVCSWSTAAGGDRPAMGRSRRSQASD